MKLYLTKVEKKFSEKSKKDYYLATLYDFNGEAVSSNIFISQKYYEQMKDKVKVGSFIEVGNNEFDLQPILVDHQTCYRLTYIGG